MAESAPVATSEYNGEFNLNYVKLFSFRYAAEIDITNLFASMEIYESIYSPFMTMQMTILDGMGIMSKTRILGDEFLEVDCTGADETTGLKKKQFYIYKITDRTLVADRTVSYTLHCMSLEALAEMNTKVSRSYSGQPSAIAKAIVDEYLKPPVDLVFETTKNKVEYISNYWSPVRNLKFLADRAVSAESSSPGYVFYETKKSFMFTSLNLLKGQSPSDAFFYSTNTKNPAAPEQRMHIIDSMYVDEGFDYIKNLKSGAYGTRSLIVNPMTKTYVYGYYDVIEAFEKYGRLNEEPFSSIDSPRRLNSFLQSRIAPSSSFGTMPSENTSDWFTSIHTENASIEAQKIQIDVTGKFNIYAGNVVELYVYSEETGEGDTMYTALDTVYSGRYLVMSICHHIDRERHSMSLQLNKDSLIKYSQTTSSQK